MLTATIHGSRGTLRATLLFGPINGTKGGPASNAADTTIIPLPIPGHQPQGDWDTIFDLYGAQRRWNAFIQEIYRYHSTVKYCFRCFSQQ